MSFFTQIYYHLPTKLRENNVFIRVCVCLFTEGMVSDMTIIHDSLDPTIQALPPNTGNAPPGPQTWELTTQRHPDMFKRVHFGPQYTAPPYPDIITLIHYETCTVSKQAVCVLLEYFLVLITCLYSTEVGFTSCIHFKVKIKDFFK